MLVLGTPGPSKGPYLPLGLLLWKERPVILHIGGRDGTGTLPLTSVLRSGVGPGGLRLGSLLLCGLASAVGEEKLWLTGWGRSGSISVPWLGKPVRLCICYLVRIL